MLIGKREQNALGSLHREGCASTLILNNSTIDPINYIRHHYAEFQICHIVDNPHQSLRKKSSARIFTNCLNRFFLRICKTGTQVKLKLRELVTHYAQMAGFRLVNKTDDANIRIVHHQLYAHVFQFYFIHKYKYQPLTCPLGILSPRGEEEVTFYCL